MAKASPLDPVAEQWQKSSQAALDTSAQMMVDVAHDHLENIPNIDALPLCCAYNLRAAREIIEQSPSLVVGADFKKSVDSLLILENVFKRRWHAP